MQLLAVRVLRGVVRATGVKLGERGAMEGG